MAQILLDRIWASKQVLVRFPWADPRGPGGLGPLAPKNVFKIMQFSGNFKEKILFWANLGSGPQRPLGSTLRWPWPKSWIPTQKYRPLWTFKQGQKVNPLLTRQSPYGANVSGPWLSLWSDCSPPTQMPPPPPSPDNQARTKNPLLTHHPLQPHDTEWLAFLENFLVSLFPLQCSWLSFSTTKLNVVRNV